MKNIIILTGRRDWKKGNTKLWGKAQYQKCYEYLYTLAPKHNVMMFRCSYQWYDRNKKIFKYAWIFKNNKWQRTYNIKPDIIYDKTKFRTETHDFCEKISKDYPIINEPDFTLIANNKLYVSMLFTQYMKKGFRITNNKELKEYLPKLKTSKIVIKPIYGSGGDKVEIIDKKYINRIKINTPSIVQEFIDSSNGIKNIIKGIHDLRLVFINNDLIYSYIRTPAKGSLLANLAQGGNMFIIDKKKLPKSLNPLIKNIQETFSHYRNKVYTIDLMFDKKQHPWIVELNTKPGLYFSSEQKKWMDIMYLGLIKLFKTI